MHNHWITLSSFFTWLQPEFALPSPMPNVPAPKFEDAQVERFPKEEIEKLLKACDYSREAETDRRRKFTMQRATAHRDRALMLVLLDTGYELRSWRRSRSATSTM